MKEVKFIVYQYTFTDNKVYIGRSRTDQDRFMNKEKYKGQYVYKQMCNQRWCGDILYESSNPFIIYHLEEILINHYYEQSYNASLEEDWKGNVFRDIASKKLDYTLDDLQYDLEEYKNSDIQGIAERILRQTTSWETKN